MTHWALDPTGRFPQALADHLAALPFDSDVEAFLEAGAWIIANGFHYDNTGEWRLTGIYGSVDCSGMVVLCTNAARARMGQPAINMPTNSATIASDCHNRGRPQWMIDKFGPGIGFGVNAWQAAGMPASLAFHGWSEGRLGFGNSGHIKSKWWIDGGHPHEGPNVSMEAAGHYAGVGYFQFVDPKCTYFAISPYLDGLITIAPKVKPMFDPNLKLAARLWHPDGGVWEAYDNGVVDFIYPKPRGKFYRGGMVRPDSKDDPGAAADRAAWGNRHVAQLVLRNYRSGLRRKWGYTIVATTGEAYVPNNQK